MSMFESTAAEIEGLHRTLKAKLLAADERDRMAQATAALSKGLSQSGKMEIQRIGENFAAMVRALGTTSEQAAKVLAEFSTRVKLLKKEEKLLLSKQTWYRRGRW